MHSQACKKYTTYGRQSLNVFTRTLWLSIYLLSIRLCCLEWRNGKYTSYLTSRMHAKGKKLKITFYIYRPQYFNTYDESTRQSYVKIVFMGN